MGPAGKKPSPDLAFGQGPYQPSGLPYGLWHVRDQVGSSR
ncbi:hypothetical protein ATKI12_3046 [Kitasatospora sp. Ki12]